MTLTETVVTVAIITIVFGSLMYVIQNFYRSNAYVLEASLSVDSARRGMTTALQNLREASYADDGNYPIASAATSSLTFYSDVDADIAIERVRVYIQNNTLYKGVTNPAGNPPSYTGQTEATTTIVSYVRNGTSTALFQYYNAAGAQLATTSPDISAIRTVRATLDIDLNPNRAPNVFRMTGSATLRNLRDE